MDAGSWQQDEPASPTGSIPDESLPAFYEVETPRAAEVDEDILDETIFTGIQTDVDDGYSSFEPESDCENFESPPRKVANKTSSCDSPVVPIIPIVGQVCCNELELSGHIKPMGKTGGRHEQPEAQQKEHVPEREPGQQEQQEQLEQHPEEHEQEKPEQPERQPEEQEREQQQLEEQEQEQLEKKEQQKLEEIEATGREREEDSQSDRSSDSSSRSQRERGKDSQDNEEDHGHDRGEDAERGGSEEGDEELAQLAAEHEALLQILAEEEEEQVQAAFFCAHISRC
jgi:hypothetical protein